ncbi:hypothetical protein AYJ54_20495 [Bradyrhizobium centrolobii]|uniref:DUF2029 domain-containing protein n=1 Tax=Bradyrhizobium centrolobii TaxID=1505087 RepID=A0A176YJA1_9BRAD|nr:hypothetical protein [Bradyrhizobium centrolobii]OAF06069.1 hypothetical protein AYJ54_20495 [Bradyrhizobium centrolobii]
MSDVSSAARWSGSPADLRASRNTWLTWLIALATLLVLGSFVNDATLDVDYGWDVRINCAAVDAYVDGLDPYFLRNLKGGRFPYPYLPVTLDAFRPLCAGGFLVAHYKSIHFVLAVLCALLLPGLGNARPGARDLALRLVFALGGFLGFEWILATGNFAVLSGLLTATALALLLRPLPSEGQGGASFLPLLGGAAVLGLVTSFKLVFCPVLAALYFLPQPRHRKLILIAVAAGMFALPILISMVFYANLFPSWLSAITGQIPGQHAPGNEVNPSFLFLALVLADRFALAGSEPLVAALYGLFAVVLVLAPLAVSVWRTVWARGSAGKGSPLQALDQWLMDHPGAAIRFTVLAMYALYLCAPRLKEYAFFELALYACVLIVDLPATALAAVLTVAIIAPALASFSGSAFVGGFGQLATALICFWLLLSRRSAPPDLSAP